MKFTFFSMNEFVREGGETIRMLGILNELAARGNEVVFVSNTLRRDLFHPGIEHHYIDRTFSPGDKRIFQAMLGVLPISVVNARYRNLLERLKVISIEHLNHKNVFFFEYLDNSVAYWLKVNDLIDGYINDLHGIATIELDFQAKSSDKLQDKIKFKSKYYVARKLDEKVFQNASGLIFASNAMKEFYFKAIPSVASKKSYVLPYLLGSEACSTEVNEGLRQKLLRQYNLKKEDKLILFAGAFKKTGGVPDLIKAYAGIQNEYDNVRLLLIGDGPTMPECLRLVEKENLSEKVIFAGMIPHKNLRTYQSVSEIIACPDRQNRYSELIVHVKYFDALASGKIVINGAFGSVLEINENEALSLNFKPSNIQSLQDALRRSLNNFHSLKQKYKSNRTFACEKLTYKSHVEVLED